MTHVARIVERICKNGDIMTDKKNKKKEAQRYSREHDEPFLTFVTRIVNTENKAMTVNEICDKMDGASRSVRSNVHWHTSCSDAVRRGWIEKTRFPDTKGRNRVHYHPLTLHPIGDEIPRPLFVKQGAIDEPPVFVHEGGFLQTSPHNMDEGIDLDDLPADPAPANLNVGKINGDWLNLDTGDRVCDPDPDAFMDDGIEIELGNDAMKTVQAWEELNGQERVAVLQLLSSPVKATRTKHIFDAEDFVDTLHAINPRLYEQVLDTIGDAIQVGGTWTRTVTGMMVYNTDNTGEEV